MQCNCGHEPQIMMKAMRCVVYATPVTAKVFYFQVNLLKKKTITDIAFLDEKDVKDDPLGLELFT